VPGLGVPAGVGGFLAGWIASLSLRMRGKRAGDGRGAGVLPRAVGHSPPCAPTGGGCGKLLEREKRERDAKTTKMGAAFAIQEGITCIGD
jgi:hypothetical protein